MRTLHTIRLHSFLAPPVPRHVRLQGLTQVAHAVKRCWKLGERCLLILTAMYPAVHREQMALVPGTLCAVHQFVHPVQCEHLCDTAYLALDKAYSAVLHSAPYVRILDGDCSWRLWHATVYTGTLYLRSKPASSWTALSCLGPWHGASTSPLRPRLTRQLSAPNADAQSLVLTPSAEPRVPPSIWQHPHLSRPRLVGHAMLLKRGTLNLRRNPES